jgi:tetratricopeptide (TPR) repeat protein
LFDYYKAKGHAREVAHGRPQCLEDLLPWYTAAPHGCNAGLYSDALNQVYRERILRGSEQFSTSVLGMMGADFAVLYAFFDRPFDLVNSALSPADAAFVQHQTGYCLRAQGRLSEAAACFERVLTHRVENREWREAAVVAGLVSQTYLSSGELGQAIEFGARAVGYADQAADPLNQLKERTALAYMKHQAGRIAEAEEAFRETEQIRRLIKFKMASNAEKATILLCLFHEADLQIALGPDAATNMAAKLEAAAGQYPDIMASNKNAAALIWNVLGRAKSHLSARGTHPAGVYFSRAVEAGRDSGREDVLPILLLGRAEFRRQSWDFQGAWGDVREAMSTAERHGMRLYLADALLASVRLDLDDHQSGSKEERLARAGKQLRAAATLIAETGYFRRDAELNELTARLGEAKK